MVVDDDPTIRDMMVDILECEGHTPELARDGEEALRLLNGPTNYLVFLDLLMPTINGKDLCIALAAQPHVRQRHVIVLMSALDNMEETFNLDVDMVMSKPFMV
ncbi:MAG: response regulator transcription factor, partial [Ktedonobacteraceae bacterium]